MLQEESRGADATVNPQSTACRSTVTGDTSSMRVRGGRS